MSKQFDYSYLEIMNKLKDINFYKTCSNILNYESLMAIEFLSPLLVSAHSTSVYEGFLTYRSSESLYVSVENLHKLRDDFNWTTRTSNREGNHYEYEKDHLKIRYLDGHFTITDYNTHIDEL